jgi:hypothetical protein
MTESKQYSIQDSNDDSDSSGLERKTRCTLTKKYDNPQENSDVVCKKHKSAIKPKIRQVYRYVDNVDRMLNSYLTQSWTWKWTTGFLILRLDILNTFLSQTSCGTKMTGRDIKHSLV